MRENLFQPFNSESKGFTFLQCVYPKWGHSTICRRIHDVLQQIKVRADVKTVELTRKRTTIFGNEKTESIGWQFQVIFDPETPVGQKEKVYAAMIGFNMGYWNSGV